MKIYGMNKKACEGLWVVYITINKHKYFFGAYSTEIKAQKVSNKYNGLYRYITKS